VRYILEEYIDLKQIAESGQCFRWRMGPNNEYLVIAGDKYAYIKADYEGESTIIEIECDKKNDNFWTHYLDLETSYSDIRSKIMKKDRFLGLAADNRSGIRILNQDPWEMLITFIVSQRKNIPAITACVEKLSVAAGQKIGKARSGEDIYSFPSPEALAGLSIDDLNACSLGYRSKYIKRAAEDVLGGMTDLDALSHLDDEALHAALCELYGVGVKVANCVVLFGYHRLNAFPIDVWIERVLTEHYPEGFPFKRYSPYCGVMQQYLFSYYRDTHK